MKRDIIHLHLALTNNISKIVFSPTLDPLITPKEQFTFKINNFLEYLDYFDKALESNTSDEPEIVEYYLLKYQLKSMEELMDDYEGEDEDSLMMVDINDFISYGNEADFFLVDYFAGQYVESFDKKRAIEYYEEGERVACERGNEFGMNICRENYERVIRDNEED